MAALGYLQVNTGNYKQGIALFDELIRANPKVIAAYLGRGTAYALMGDLDQAIKDFSKAIQSDPTVADAWKRRGQARAARGYDRDAIEDFNRAEALSVDHEVMHQRGLVYHKMVRASGWRGGYS